MISIDVTSAFRGLNDSQIAEVIQAAKDRAYRSARFGAPVDQEFVSRCLIEYAQDAKQGRPLEVGLHSAEELKFERNYGDQYLSPRGDY